MEDRRDKDQYCFDQRMADSVADFLERFERPCVLGALMVGNELEERGSDVVTLDTDERFSCLTSLRRWDLCRPEPFSERFGVLFSAPSFRASLSQVFHAVCVLAQSDFTRPIALIYPAQRREAVLGTFAPFKLRATGISPGYRTVRASRRNDIEIYANFELRGTHDDQD